MGLVDIDRTNLGSQDHLIIIRDIVTGRTQTVSVKHRTHHIAVTKDDRCRAIPWLHHGCIIAVEILYLLRHELVMLPRCRDHDHNGHRKLHTTHDHKFQGIIKHRGVGTFLADDRKNLVHVRLKELCLHVLLTSHHFIYIAPDGIDLAVVDNDAVRMGTHPARICVGTETGMYGCNGRLVIRILQILKELAQLLYQEHTLVYNGTAAHGCYIGIIITLFKDAACNIETAVKLQSLLNFCRLFNEALHDIWHLFHSLVTDLFRMDRKGSPAEEFQSLFLYDDFQHFLCLISCKLILREEEHADTVLSCLSKLNTKRLCHLFEEFVGDLQHDADTVSGLSFCVLTGAVL